MVGIFTSLQHLLDGCLKALTSHFARWTKLLRTSLPLSTFNDLSRSRSELIAENALLRHHLIMLKRQVKRPTGTNTNRLLLVLLARLVRTWQQALFIVQPDTLLRWHRELFRLYWKRKSKTSAHQPKVAAETIALIRRMATDNRLWGAERIRGELLKLGLRVCKRTIQKYLRTVRTPQPRGQKWSTDLAHARRPDLGMRRAYKSPMCSFARSRAFFLIELQSRKADPCGRDTLADRYLGGPTASGSHPLWAGSQIFDTR